MAAAAAASAPAVVRPSRNAGTMTWSVIRPSTHAAATVMNPYTALPVTAAAKITGSCRIPTPRIPSPRLSTDLSTRWLLTRLPSATFPSRPG